MDDDLTCCCGCILVIFIIFAGISVLGNLGSHDSTVTYSNVSESPTSYNNDYKGDGGDDMEDEDEDNDTLSSTDNKDFSESTHSSHGTYVGSVNSDKFHYSSCSQANRIKEGNLVTFSSRDDAINSGYSPCGICHP